MTTSIPCPRTRETIASRFRAGESVAELAYDYDRPTEAIEAAIREGMRAVAIDIPTHIDTETLDELDDGERAATPAPWEWWTSNSWRRLSGPDGADGRVLCPDNHPIDHHPDLRVSREDMWLIENLRNSARALIDEARESLALRELLQSQTSAANELARENQRLRAQLATACEMADQAMVEVCKQ